MLPCPDWQKITKAFYTETTKHLIKKTNITQEFKLKKGEVLFEKDKVVISDDAGKQKALAMLTSGFWVIYGTFSVLRYLKTGDQFLLWTGLFIGAFYSAVLILWLFRTVKKEIALSEIKSIKAGSQFGNKFLDIKLKNQRKRRIAVDNPEELNKYVEANFRLG